LFTVFKPTNPLTLKPSPTQYAFEPTHTHTQGAAALRDNQTQSFQRAVPEDTEVRILCIIEYICLFVICSIFICIKPFRRTSPSRRRKRKRKRKRKRR
jgi:hypothetical protein